MIKFKLTNDGKTGWFPDAKGDMHFFKDIRIISSANYDYKYKRIFSWLYIKKKEGRFSI